MRVVTLAPLAACVAVALGCQESGFDEREETARPLKVQHVLGESKVPGQAEAPATLSLEALDDTLALGPAPVAATVPGGELPAYLREPGAEVELLRAGALPPPDADVIVASAPLPRTRFAELGAIAPTVVIDRGGATWKLNVRLVGEALGRTNAAEALLSDYDERVARVRASLPRDAGVALNGAGPDSFAATVLADAGVELMDRGRAEATLAGPLWTGPGGILAARTALTELQGVLQE